MYHYKTHGTCSSEIELEIQNGIITHCKFIGGCKGNTQGLADEVAQRLEGIPCRGNTSCPDQLSKAIHEYHE